MLVACGELVGSCSCPKDPRQSAEFKEGIRKFSRELNNLRYVAKSRDRTSKSKRTSKSVNLEANKRKRFNETATSQIYVPSFVPT